MKKVMFSILISAFIVGCAGKAMNYMTYSESRPVIKATPDLSTVVIFRFMFYGAPWVFKHYVDGKLIGENKGRTWFMAKIKPGKHYLMSHSEIVATAYMNFKPGKIYYLSEGAVIGLDRVRPTGFGPLSEREAIEGEKTYRYLEFQSTKDAEDMDLELYKQSIKDYEKEIKENPAGFKDILGYDGV